jgi:hypothetical protein
MDLTSSIHHQRQEDLSICGFCGKKFNFLSKKKFIEGKLLHSNCDRLYRESQKNTRPKGECQLCGKKLTWLGGKINYEGYFFHFDCLPKWRKQQVVSEINSEIETTINFKIPTVVFIKHPGSKEENPMGDVYFTNKGLYFVQRGSAPAQSKAPGLLFGIVGEIVSNADHAAKVDLARQNLKPSWGVTSSFQFVKTIEAAMDIWKFPRDAIVGIEACYVGFELETLDTKVEFELPKKKDSFLVFKDEIYKYLNPGN